MASNNDGGVREYDMERFQLINHFHFPWPVNVSFLQDLAKHLFQDSFFVKTYLMINFVTNVTSFL